MNFLVQAILPYILLYKYWALFTVTFLASSALPIPAGTLLVTSAAFASQGYFKIGTLITIVIIANILGDNLLYWMARLYGKRILSYSSFFRKILISKNFTIIEKKISRKPGFLIVISRFEVISTLGINFICGLGKASYKKFLLYEIIGTLANVFFYAMLGFLFGDNWQAIDKLIGNFSIILFLIVALGVSIFWKKIIARLSRE